jgi:hypothetical protein
VRRQSQNIATVLEAYAIDNGGQYPAASAPVTLALFGGSSNNYLNATLVDPAAATTFASRLPNGVAYKLRDGDNHDTTTARL